MKQHFLPLLAFTGIIAMGACSDNTHHNSVTSLPPGTYQNSTSSSDAAGTSHSSKTTTYVSEDADGNKSAVVDKTTTTDPEGLFNKTTTKTRQVISNDQ